MEGQGRKNREKEEYYAVSVYMIIRERKREGGRPRHAEEQRPSVNGAEPLMKEQYFLFKDTISGEIFMYTLI